MLVTTIECWHNFFRQYDKHSRKTVPHFLRLKMNPHQHKLIMLIRPYSWLFRLAVFLDNLLARLF